MNFIDLFAGAGGLSEGFIRCGFRPVAHIESDLAACNTLKTRTAYHWLKGEDRLNEYVDYLRGEITRDDLYDKIPSEVLTSVIHKSISNGTVKGIFKRVDGLIKGESVDVIVGGPPCQAYSVVGRSRDKQRMEGDPRNYLYRHYGKFLRRYQPKVFVFENVLGLLSAAGGRYLKNMIKCFNQAGYELEYRVMNASDFGVLQNRKRVLLIGWRDDLDLSYPEFEKAKIKVIVSSLLSDLPPLQAGEQGSRYVSYSASTSKYLKSSGIRNGLPIVTQHVARPHTDQDKEIYRIAVHKWLVEKQRLSYLDLPERLQSHQNKVSFLDRFKVVAADEPVAQTVVAHIAKDGHYYIHPDPVQNRSISVREAARLQSFPDDYYFEGERENRNRTAAFKQIGNAVPPLMAYHLGKALFTILNPK